MYDCNFLYPVYTCIYEHFVNLELISAQLVFVPTACKRNLHALLLRLAGDDNAMLDLTVSFDGTWMRRGHKSLYGVGFVVEPWRW